jgi:hypothetical protein
MYYNVRESRCVGAGGLNIPVPIACSSKQRETRLGAEMDVSLEVAKRTSDPKRVRGSCRDREKPACFRLMRSCGEEEERPAEPIFSVPSASLAGLCSVR